MIFILKSSNGDHCGLVVISLGFTVPLCVKCSYCKHVKLHGIVRFYDYWLLLAPLVLYDKLLCKKNDLRYLRQSYTRKYGIKKTKIILNRYLIFVYKIFSFTNDIGNIFRYVTLLSVCMSHLSLDVKCEVCSVWKRTIKS